MVHRSRTTIAEFSAGELSHLANVALRPDAELRFTEFAE
jgi:hypothetical protein